MANLPASNNNNTGPQPILDCRTCIKCQRVGNSLCSRCSSSYCSIECQYDDWQRHRFQCVPKSPYEHLRRCAEALDASESNTNKDSMIIEPLVLAHVLNQQVVFVRLITDEANAAFARTLRAIKEHSRHKPINPTDLKAELKVMVLHKNNIYRAIVVNVYNDGPVVVNRIDIGDVIQVARSQLYESSWYLRQRRAHAMKIILKGISTGRYNCQQVAYLMHLLHEGTELLVKYEANGDEIEGDLIVKSNGFSVNKHLLTLASSGGDLAIYKRPVVEKIIKFIPITGTNVKMTILDNSMMHVGTISCVPSNERIHLVAMNNAINAFCRTKPALTSYRPKLHEVCLAFCRLQRRWLRAIFLDVDQSMKIMQFIDRGDVKRVDSVRPLPPQFAEYPCCTVQCMVDDLNDAMNDSNAPEKADFCRKHFVLNKEIVFDDVQFVETQICRCQMRQVKLMNWRPPRAAPVLKVSL